MAWTTISNALVAVGAKPFATTIQALRDNIEFLRNALLGLEPTFKVLPRSLSDTIYLGRLATSGTSWQAMTGLGDIKKVRIDLWYDSAGVIFLGLSSDGRATWSSDVTIGVTSADLSLLVADLETGALGSAGKVNVSTTVSGGPFNALRIRNNTTGSFAAIVTALTGGAGWRR